MRKNKGITAFSAGATTLIAQGAHIIGDIHFSGNLEVEGTVTGNIVAEEGADARVRILEQGRVNGDVRVPNVIINGSIEGDTYSSSHVELASKAVVEGNVHYALIEIERGAQVNGSFVHEAAEQVTKLPVEEEKTEESGPISAAS